MKKIRAGIRLNSRVAIAVEWSEAGRTLRSEGYTLDISPKGCLAIFPQGFTVGQTITADQSDEPECVRRGARFGEVTRDVADGNWASNFRKCLRNFGAWISRFALNAVGLRSSQPAPLPKRSTSFFH